MAVTSIYHHLSVSKTLLLLVVTFIFFSSRLFCITASDYIDSATTVSLTVNSSSSKPLDRLSWLHERWTNLYDSISSEEAATVHREVTLTLFPVTYDCTLSKLKRIGKGGDGGKWVCTEFLPSKLGSGETGVHSEQCTMLSFGSNGDFSFELGMLAVVGEECQMHTFDCTVSVSSPHPRVHFHQWCLGANNVVTGDGRVFKTWGQIMEDLGITRIDHLKMDIEGWEMVGIPAMLGVTDLSQPINPKNWPLPKQINMEVHYARGAEAIRWNFFGPGKPRAEGVIDGLQTPDNEDFLHPAINFFRLMYKAGYEVATYEWNNEAMMPCCAEYTFIRSNDH